MIKASLGYRYKNERSSDHLWSEDGATTGATRTLAVFIEIFGCPLIFHRRSILLKHICMLIVVGKVLSDEGTTHHLRCDHSWCLLWVDGLMWLLRSGRLKAWNRHRTFLRIYLRLVWLGSWVRNKTECHSSGFSWRGHARILLNGAGIKAECESCMIDLWDYLGSVNTYLSGNYIRIPYLGSHHSVYHSSLPYRANSDRGSIHWALVRFIALGNVH